MIKIGARNTGYSINIFRKIIHTYIKQKNLLQDVDVETAKDDANNNDDDDDDVSGGFLPSFNIFLCCKNMAPLKNKNHNIIIFTKS